MCCTDESVDAVWGWLMRGRVEAMEWVGEEVDCLCRCGGM